LKDQRNKVQNRGDPEVIVGSELVPISPLWTVHLPDGSPLFGEEGIPTQTLIPVQYYQSNLGDHDAMAHCQHYLDLLTMLVTDFLMEHGQ
jgi:hypothetical protein